MTWEHSALQTHQFTKQFKQWLELQLCWDSQSIQSHCSLNNHLSGWRVIPVFMTHMLRFLNVSHDIFPIHIKLISITVHIALDMMGFKSKGNYSWMTWNFHNGSIEIVYRTKRKSFFNQLSWGPASVSQCPWLVSTQTMVWLLIIHKPQHFLHRLFKKIFKWCPLSHRNFWKDAMLLIFFKDVIFNILCTTNKIPTVL